MDVDAPASTWMTSPHRRPAVTLTFDLNFNAYADTVWWRQNENYNSVISVRCNQYADCDGSYYFCALITDNTQTLTVNVIAVCQQLAEIHKI